MGMNIRVGFAMCGSFCTFERCLNALRQLRQQYDDVQPILSETAYGTDTRFALASDVIAQMEQICGKRPWHSIPQVEPIGPKKLLDVLVVAPCTGNTLAKLAAGVTDSSVTMAVKAHLRNERPVVLAVSTNDGLSASAKNIGELMSRRNMFFVPFGQDDPYHKPRSLVAHMELLPETIAAALQDRQLQPMLRAAN